MGKEDNTGNGSEILDLAEVERASGIGVNFDQGATDRSRDSYRMPARQNETVKVEVDGKGYEIIDIGSHGIGIAICQSDHLRVDKVVHSIRLSLHDKDLQLTGRVVHISPDGTENFLCGIELVDMDSKSEKELQKFIQNHRHAMFKG